MGSTCQETAVISPPTQTTSPNVMWAMIQANQSSK